jgi:hypothetical protein
MNTVQYLLYIDQFLSFDINGTCDGVACKGRSDVGEKLCLLKDGRDNVALTAILHIDD